MNKEQLLKKIHWIGNALPSLACCLSMLCYALISITTVQRILSIGLIAIIALIGAAFVYAVSVFFFRFSNKSPLLRQPTPTESAALLLAILSIGWIWTSALVSMGGNWMGLSYFRKCVFYSIFIVGLFSAIETKPVKTRYWPSYTAVFATLFFFLSFVAKIGITYSGSTHNICLNLSNSNELGMVVCFVAAAVFALGVKLFFKPKRNWLLLALVFATFAIDAFLLLLSGARGSQLALIAFVVGFLLLRIGKYVFRDGAIAIAVLFPLFFASAYLFYVFIAYDFDLSAATAGGFIDGKSFFTRVDIWIRGIKTAMSNPLIGDYFAGTEGSGVGQLHNIAIDMLSCFGIIGYTLISGFVFSIIRIVMFRQQGENPGISLITASILGATIILTFEASIPNVPTLLAIFLPCFMLDGVSPKQNDAFTTAHLCIRGRR